MVLQYISIIFSSPTRVDQAFPCVQLHSATQPVCALCSRPVRNTHECCSRISAPSRAFAAIARTYPGRLLLHPGWCAGATSQCERVRGLRVSFSVLALRARDDSIAVSLSSGLSRAETSGWSPRTRETTLSRNCIPVPGTQRRSDSRDGPHHSSCIS